MALFGHRIREIKLSGFGICITAEKTGTEPVHESLAVLLAGPAVNIVMYLLLAEKVPETAYLSLGAGLYNMLPYSQLDGGAVIETLISGSLHERGFRTALELLRIAITAASAVMVYIYGMEAVPALAALTALYIGGQKQPESS